ncbi:MAG TPA: hypothetical protein VGK04_05420 [Thermoanaerobaculia bacterium]
MNDDDLRDAFAKLRESERHSAPAFRIQGRRDAGTTRRLVVVAAMLVLIIAVGYFSRSKPQQTTTSISTWRAPTDSLLRTPGHELLDSLPQLQPTIPGGRS